LKVTIADGMGTENEININKDKVSGEELLKQLGINLFEAMIIKNGEIVNENTILTSKDRVKVINVIHGG